MRRSASPRPARRAVLVVLCAAMIVTGAYGCLEPTTSPRPSPSLIELDFTPPPTTGPSANAEGSPRPTLVSWPIGWDVAFCGALSEVVTAQELVIDVERAIDEDANRDAMGLARELTLVATGASQLLVELPEWGGAGEVVASLAALMDLGARAGTEYETHLDNNRRPPLRRARALRREIADAVPAANEQLQVLADVGLSCPGTPLELESP